MYKKILKVMIALVITFLSVLYVLKIFTPNKFVMIIQSHKLIKIGNYIDAHWWLCELCAIITSFITYWLYLGAVTKKLCLNWKEILLILLTIVIVHATHVYDEALASGISIISMLVLPAIFKAKLKEVAIVFSVHYMAQLASTLIRSLPLLLTKINYAIILLMGLECYLWLLLFYFYFNLKKEK